MLCDNKTGRIALKSHDLYQTVLASLDKSTQSFLNKEVKGIFPHKLINDMFSKYTDILDKNLILNTNLKYIKPNL